VTGISSFNVSSINTVMNVTSFLVISGYHDIIILSFLYRSEGDDLVKYPDWIVLEVALHCFVN
jgi:hypothetical protein